MRESKEQYGYSLIAVYSDREPVERALRRLHDDGIDMRNVFIVGNGFEAEEVPAGVVTTGDVAETGAEIGAIAGGIAGLLMGTAFLVVPIVGPVFVAGPFAAALAGAAEGALAGAVVGGLTGAFVGWGVPAVHVQRYERHVSDGKFLVLVKGDCEQVEHVRSVLAFEWPEHCDVHESST